MEDLLSLEKIKKWASNNYLQIGIFNMAIVFALLLRSAGYFHPYITISVNLVVLFALILSIILFRANSSVIFFICLCFWAFSGLLLLLGVGIWAERASIYAFESVSIGVILLVFEGLGRE